MRGRAARSFTVVTQYFPPERGAAQVRLGSIVRELVRRGETVDVVTALPNYPTGRIFPGWPRRPVVVTDEGGARVLRVLLYPSMGSGVARIANYATFGLMALIGQLRARRSDRLVVEYPTLFGALPAVVLGRRRRQQVVLIVADLWVDSIAELGVVRSPRVLAALGRIETWMFRRADVVSAVTDGVREELVRKGVDPGRLAWLPNGADTELFRPEEPTGELQSRLGLSEHDHVVLYAGTHGYVHRLQVVLDAAAQLGGHPVHFVLVGDGSEKPDLVAEARARGLENVTFLDPVDPERVADMLRDATAGLATVRAGDVYRSIRSAKMLPTMAAGRPVLYSGFDEGSALVQRHGAGVVTEPEDASALAEAVVRIIGDPEAAQRMGAAGRRWVVDHASWSSLVASWVDQLDELAASGPGDAPPAASREALR